MGFHILFLILGRSIVQTVLTRNSQEWAAVTFNISADTVKLLSKVMDIFLEEIQPILGVKDVIPSMVMQPINRDEIRLFGKNGGNCLGIMDGDGPLLRKLTFSSQLPLLTWHSVQHSFPLVSTRRQPHYACRWKQYHRSSCVAC